MKFNSMRGKLDPALLGGLERMSYDTMTPVQQRVLSELPRFSDDCLVRAKTGTGKTLAFLLPTLQSLLTAGGVPRGQVGLLILAPTRELAQQIAHECDKVTALQPVECHLAVGGNKKDKQLNKFLNGNPTVLVATPGRLTDYLSEDHVRARFANLRSVVLDEADTMLDRGFMEALLDILKALPAKASAGWQGMCFSATLPPRIDPVLHHVLKPGCLRITTVEESEVPTVDTIPQFLVTAPTIFDVLPLVHSILVTEKALCRPDPLKALVFSSTARNAGLLYQVFSDKRAVPGVPVWQIHSRLGQPARTATTAAFKAANCGLLFASDVVGRGMDFPNIGLIVQIGLPMDNEQYVHRVGRTGRAGKVGRAVVVMLPSEQKFLHHNRNFPITPYKTDLQPQLAASYKIIEEQLATVSEDAKGKAYQAFLGFNKGHLKLLGLDKQGVVQLANEFAEALGCAETPALQPSTVAKMGLRGVAGIRLADPSQYAGGHGRAAAKRARPQPAASENSGSKPVKKLRKQKAVWRTDDH